MSSGIFLTIELAKLLKIKRTQPPDNVIFRMKILRDDDCKGFGQVNPK
jgi:hypothetical protein